MTSGRPLVLLPGMLCSPALFSGVRAALDGVPTVDVPLTAASIEGMADEVLGVPYDSFRLAGLSLGGIVALAVARRAPARVERLALLSTTARPPRPDQLTAWTQALARVTAGASAREEQRRLLPLLLRPELLERDPPLVDVVLSMADEVGEAALAAQLRAQATRIDARPALRELRCPTLVVAARQDELCPVSRHEEIAAAVPGARLEVLEDCGHLSTLERPDTVASLVRAWMDDVPGPAPTGEVTGPGRRAGAGPRRPSGSTSAPPGSTPPA
jgi:pimeloyl-ACP methyl ester carboxylesterase